MLETVTLRFLEAHPEDAARVLGRMDGATLGEVVRAMPADTAARVLRHLTPDGLADCLRELGPEAAPIVQLLPVAISAPALRALPSQVLQALLAAVPRTLSLALHLSLRYPSGSVGALMDPLAISVRADMTVGDAVQNARRAPEMLRRYVYVLDAEQRLIGVVDVRECLLSARGTMVRSVMQPDPAFLRVRSSLEEARANPAWARFDVLPVVDRSRIFLGVLRRRVLDTRLARDRDASPGNGDLKGTFVDLANLYWQASSTVFLGRDADKAGDGER